MWFLFILDNPSFFMCCSQGPKYVPCTIVSISSSFSGGIGVSKSSHTIFGIECPWLARMQRTSSLSSPPMRRRVNRKRCLSLLATTRSTSSSIQGFRKRRWPHDSRESSRTYPSVLISKPSDGAACRRTQLNACDSSLSLPDCPRLALFSFFSFLVGGFEGDSGGAWRPELVTVGGGMEAIGGSSLNTTSVG